MIRYAGWEMGNLIRYQGEEDDLAGFLGITGVRRPITGPKEEAYLETGLRGTCL